MALLPLNKRKEYFRYLGLGTYNEKNILRLQKKYMLREQDWDGKYGPHTDELLRHLVNVKRFAPSFRPEEFRCGCGGRYCDGYPVRMKTKELKQLQAIRDKFKLPVTITSGVRCRRFNDSLRGSSKSSRHLTGYAADFYIKGLTNTLNGRKKVIRFARKQPDHHYSYCNGYNSLGQIVTAPNMGTAIHTDTH